MEVLLANPRSFCAGVERAVSIVEQALERHGAPVYVYHEIVHNNTVLDALRRRGARFVDALDEVPAGAVLVFNAHGVSPAVVEQAARRGLHVLDATCPLVTKVHREVVQHHRQGRQVVLVGTRGHAEVTGTLGQVPSGIHLVETPDDVRALPLDESQPVAWATQTTLSVDEAAEAVQAVRRRFPAAVGPKASDICYASQNRQAAVKALAQHCEVLIVVGSPQSHNTARLADAARAAGCAAYRVEGAAQVDPAWLAGARAVGVTAGASAPPQQVEEVVALLQSLGATAVREMDGPRETVVFPMPEGLRRAGLQADAGPGR